MTISTLHPVEMIICRTLHRQPMSDLQVGTFNAYADVLWSLSPEKGEGSG